MPVPITLDAIRDAAARIRDVVRLTPLVEVGGAPPRLLLKCENLQRTGSFKIRGAYNLMSRLVATDPRFRGAITYSSGNHGLAVAAAARLLGVPAVVVMPTSAAGIKVEGVRDLGAEVLFAGRTTIERQARAEAEAESRGLAVVPPFDHPDIMAGQGTAGLEIVEQCPDVAAVYVQMSGGGLISGVASAIRALKPDVQIIGVEPAGAAKMTASLRAGRPVTLERTASIADGLLAVRPGDLTFPVVQALVDRVMTIDDQAIVAAIRYLFGEAKLVAEPSGAITVAAARADAAPAVGPAVAFLSGGNVSPGAYADYLRQP